MRHLKNSSWPYQITTTILGDMSKENWCKDTIGKMSKDWYSFCISESKEIFAFKKEEDLLVFKLKWSENGN